MLTNYANKLSGIKKRLIRLLKVLDDDSKEFDYADFNNLVSDLELSFQRITDSLMSAAAEKFRKQFYRR